MALLVHGILISWLVAVPLACYSRLPRHLVLGAAFLLGLLFLPMVHAGDASDFAAIKLTGLELSKYKVISLAVLLAVLATDMDRLSQFRLSWVDVPMISWFLCPIPSILGGPLPPDGGSRLTTALSESFGQFLLWGVPYFVGRIYFSTFERLRDFACLFFLSAILYLPLCLYEIRMSPQLHERVFGFFQHDFLQTERYDGYRPMVFMQHGLALGMFLVGATVIAFMLWWSDALQIGDADAPEDSGGPSAEGDVRVMSEVHALLTAGPTLARLLPYLLLLLAITTVLVKSTGALVLGAIGIGVLALSRWLGTRLPFVCLLLVCPLYLGARTSGWQGTSLVPVIEEYFGKDRAQSFEFRQDNEELLIDQAFEGPPFGWGGWGRNLVFDAEGQAVTIPDGLWIIVLGTRGLPGLILLWLAMLLPAVRFLWTQPVSTWTEPTTACALLVVLYMIDCLMNDMHNHAFIVLAGALAGIARHRSLELPHLSGME